MPRRSLENPDAQLVLDEFGSDGLFGDAVALGAQIHGDHRSRRDPPRDGFQLRYRVGRAARQILAEQPDRGVGRKMVAIVVEDGRHRRDWVSLGASAVLPSTLTRSELVDALETHAIAISRRDVLPAAEA